jgi:hypothetical protein
VALTPDKFSAFVSQCHRKTASQPTHSIDLFLQLILGGLFSRCRTGGWREDPAEKKKMTETKSFV